MNESNELDIRDLNKEDIEIIRYGDGLDDCIDINRGRSVIHIAHGLEGIVNDSDIDNLIAALEKAKEIKHNDAVQNTTL